MNIPDAITRKYFKPSKSKWKRRHRQQNRTEKKSVLEEIAEAHRKVKMYLDALQLLEDKYAALEHAKREVAEARKFFEEFRKNYYDIRCPLAKKIMSNTEDAIFEDIGQIVLLRENTLVDLIYEWQ